MQIVFLAHTPAAHSAFRVGSHFLAREFEHLGHECVHVAPPRWRWRDRIRFTDLSRSNDLGIHELRLRPQLPIPEAIRLVHPGAYLDTRLSSVLRAQMRRWLGPHWDAPDVVVVDKVNYDSIARTMNSRAIVYRPTDIFDFKRCDPLAARQHALTVRSDAVIATSLRTLDFLVEYVGRPRRSFVEPNGANVTDLVQHRSRERRKRCVYVGAVDKRFDAGAVLVAAQELPDWTFDIYGPVTTAVRSLPNLSFHGPLAPRLLGPTLADALVGLLPLARDQIRNIGRSPMKYYEYRALGLFVVAPDFGDVSERNDPDLIRYGATLSLASAIRATEGRHPSTSEESSLLRHDWRTVASRYLGHFDDILGD